MKPNRRKPRIAPGVWTEAERLMRAGVSNLEIANRLGMAEGTVRNRRKRLGVPAPPAPDAPALAPAPAPKADAKPTDAGAYSIADTLALVREMIAENRNIAARAKEDGNTTAAARAMRDATTILPLLGRLEKLLQGNQDAVSIPRESIDTLTADIYANARTLGSVPLACPHCLRDLRMAAVGAERDRS